MKAPYHTPLKPSLTFTNDTPERAKNSTISYILTFKKKWLSAKY